MHRYICIFFLLLSLPGFAQDSLLTLDSAIFILIKNNYDVRIESAYSEQQLNNNTAGNAGMLPDINANASYLRSTNNINQTYNNGSIINRDASGSTTMNANVEAVWTIFNGMRMFTAKERLSQQYEQSRDRLMLQIESSIVELVSAYYTIIRQNQLLKALKEEMKLSEDRLIIADRKMKNGSGSKLDWLQAKTEFNRQQSLLIRLESSDVAARIELNRILGRNLEEKFSIPDTVIITYKPDFSELKKTIVTQNNNIKFYSKAQRISELQLKETKGLRSPVIDLNARYGFSRNTNDAGLVLLNQTNGFFYGAGLTFPLFNGFNIRRQIRNAQLDVTIAGTVLESYTASVSQELLNGWRDFNNNIELLRMEEENIGYAREVLNIAHERYRIGLSSVVDLQEAQRTFENAMTRVADVRYNSKLSETTLRRLNGDLITNNPVQQ